MREILGRNISILYRNEGLYVDLKLKKYNLNKVQGEVLLFLLNDDGVNQTELNNYFLFNKSTITKIITQLEKNKYVYRVAGKKDRREKDIFLTDKGKTVLPAIKDVFDRWTTSMVENIPDVDVKKIKKLMMQMVENITILGEEKNE